MKSCRCSPADGRTSPLGGVEIASRLTAMRNAGSNAGRQVSSGFTLLEVVVGLVLMASLLVSSLLAFSAHRSRAGVAEAKQAAVHYADELLHQLVSRREGVLPRDGGRVPGRANWYWQSRAVGAVRPAGIPLQVIRVRVIEITPRGDHRPLATVDVVESLR